MGRLWRGLLLAAVWLAMVAGGTLLLPTGEPREIWNAASGTDPPPEFRYLMFAGADGAELFDEPDGRPVGRLDRAVANSQQEIDAAGFVRVLGVDADRWARMADLRYEPADGRWDEPIHAWREHILDPGRNSEWRNIAAEVTPAGPATRRVAVTFTNRRFRSQRYEYAVGPAGAFAERWVRHDGLAADTSRLINGLASAAAATILIASIDLWFRRAIRRGGSPHPGA